MRKILITAIVIFLGHFTNAQVKGTLIDSASLKPIENAVIGLVIKNNATDTSYTFTNSKGQFRFEDVPISSFSIIIRHLGYWPIAK